MRKRLPFFFFCFLAWTGAFAQATGKLSGTVNDESGKALASATVSLLRLKDSGLVKLAITDKSGRFDFINLKDGKYLLSFTSVGFEKKYSSPLTVAGGEAELPPVVLLPSSKDLNNVTVSAKRPFIESRIDRTVVNVEASPSSAGATALEVLEKSPGVTVNSDGVVSLRGKAGVVMMVDGKPTYLSATDLANLLKNMPASALDQIEIMTNPSSKYDASGNAGVINIKTKKGRAPGWNGSITLGAGTSVYRLGNTTYLMPKSQNSFNFNYKKGKYNFFGNYNPNYFRGRNTMTFDRNFTENGVISGSSVQETKFKFGNNNHTLKLGVDYTADKKNTFGVVVSGFVFDGHPTPISTQTLKDAAGKTTSVIVSKTDNDISFNNFTGNLNWRHTFDSTAKELTADFDYVKYANTSDMLLASEFFNGSNQRTGDLLLKGHLPSNIDIYSFKSDLTIPFKGGRMEAGVKSSYVSNDNEVDYRRQLIDKSWIADNRSNHFIYDENINAAYLNANKQLGKWSVQGGLRLENTIAKGKQVTNDSTFRRNFTNLFPSAFVSYGINKNNQLTLSYSRRITRPNYQDLNPFTFFLDSLTYRVGNPYLLPQFTNNVELSYAYKSRFIVTANYNGTNDVISQILRQNNEKKITYLTAENVAKFRNMGLSITAPITVAKWWNANLFTNVYSNRYQGIYNDKPFDISFTSFSANLSNTFQLGKGLTGEISGFYRYKTVDQLAVIEPLYQMSLAASKQILQGKGTVRLNIRDPFAWMRFSGENKYGDIDMRFQNRPDTRQVAATFTYRFGKASPQSQPRRRNSSSQEEQSRVGQGN
ncbi:TonB-dependent receptor domain-containing protein [Flavisolibacter nicotianae]|uniref:TonB-dependent receptor domain-containing protein n=1 Tax=Flavisolibacter nicotianae TaxID=2364882 RepID=UPI000EAF005A|nr:TonB-dependent receptor [Flavisolibacter nicotianae]